MRTKKTYHILNAEILKQQLLLWSQKFNSVVWLDSNMNKQHELQYDAILAVDEFRSIKASYDCAFEKLQEFQLLTNDWIFGYLSYDIKNAIEPLKSENFDGLGFPDLYFFQPKKIFFLKGNELEVYYLQYLDDQINSDIITIQNLNLKQDLIRLNKIKIQQRINKKDYLKKINNILTYIQRGDIYEANFCQEFYAERTTINPLETFKELNSISRTPFATFFKLSEFFLISASPERYIKKSGDTLISQPIKGTAKRSKQIKEDQLLLKKLEKDQKERSENIMIVDLVRNDLSKTAIKGSVKIKELCKVYTFEQVHQMISTIQSNVDKALPSLEIIKTTFPMGSMTGAPKISAMKIIESLEETKRGIYSGCAGYFSPDGDFDFNVIIRSILYNAENEYVSFSVGSAITAKSNPLKEYQECMIKAEAMKHVLEN